MKDSFPIIARLSIYEAYGGYCCVEGCHKQAEEAHHALPNTKVNQQKYPLFINSVFNVRPVCKEHHEHYTEHTELRINERVAAVYEQALKEVKC